jgi:hypothetical protein
MTLPNAQPVLFADNQFRKLLETQVKHNQTLQEKLEKTQNELRIARAGIKPSPHANDAKTDDNRKNLDPQELLAQVEKSPKGDVVPP